jgi:damage-control phosphatase, subfamily I
VKTYLECLPCIVRQSLEGAMHATDDETLQEEVLRRSARAISEMDLHEPSPVMIGTMHRIIREVTANADPYREAREICNRNALQLYPRMKEIVEQSSNPFETALRLAAAGNTVDFIVDPHADQSDIREAVEQSLSARFPSAVVKKFQETTKSARDILYLGDNAGEIVFDRLLIEQLPAGKTTFVVRGSPVINDVTFPDAQMTGMTEVVEVIDNGSNIPGTVLHHCSESFQRRFQEADLVISKGQGNYESLNEIHKEIFFLFKAKCSVITKHLGCEIGRLILAHNNFEG